MEGGGAFWSFFSEREEKSRILRPSKTKLFEHLIYEDWLVLLFWIPFQ